MLLFLFQLRKISTLPKNKIDPFETDARLEASDVGMRKASDGTWEMAGDDLTDDNLKLVRKLEEQANQ